MFNKKLLLLVCALLFAVGIAQGKSRKNKLCATEKQCIQNNNCQCYCSRVCGWRDKEADDQPVYVADDPAGIHCYCKPWDRDNFIARGCNEQQ